MAGKNGETQRTFASSGFDAMRRPTRRLDCLRTMNLAMPWEVAGTVSCRLADPGSCGR